MGVVKKAYQEISDKINPKKKHHFMEGLKEWALSPGGIATIILIGLTIAWVEHRTAKK